MILKNKLSPFDRALKYLSYRARSEAEVRAYLGPDCTEDIIARLKRLKFIDDAKFAAWYVESRLRTRPRSRKLLELELKRKGVRLDAPSTATDLESATQALQKKSRVKSRDQVIRFLHSRGFSWDIIETVLKKRYNGTNVNY